MNKQSYILACESSCDETAFAIYDTNNQKIIDSVIYSQSELHSKLYGGVFPELASELHFAIIDVLLDELLEKTKIKINEISYMAATQTPGLPGALTIGFSFIKGMAWHLGIPFIPINHLEGHIFSAGLCHQLIFPFLCFSLSGGHTNAYLISDFGDYQPLGKTRDDACGECFDKIGKLLKLGYPAGQKIENLASIQPLENKNKYPISDLEDGSISFSGLKTAVLYDLKKRSLYDSTTHTITSSSDYQEIITIATSIQYVIKEMIIKWIHFYLKKYKVSAISIVGGVACNTIITDAVKTYAKEKYNIPCFIPQKKYCGDNADMIAYVAYQKIIAKKFHPNSYNQMILS